MIINDRVIDGLAISIHTDALIRSILVVALVVFVAPRPYIFIYL